MKKTPLTAGLGRRSFLRLSGSAGLFGLAGCAGFPAILSSRSPNSKLCHAAIGTGNMAHADLTGIMSHSQVQITALCDVDADFLARAAKLCPGARLYRNALEMMEKEGDRIDSVNVSTPDHSHYGYIREALTRKLNVYAQKPLCRSVRECREVERLAADAGAVTQMGTQIAAHDCDRETAAFLRSGVIGDVTHVWIFSNRGGQSKASHKWPLEPSPVPGTLDWKTWLADAPYRPYVKGVYHPAAWRRWRDFGSSWLGDLGLHLLSPVWIGMDLGTTGPLAVSAEYPEESPELMRQFWPRNSHVTWDMPGVKASGGKPFRIEWCDGSVVDRMGMGAVKDKWSAKTTNLDDGEVRAAMDDIYFPPNWFADLFAKTPIGKQPLQGRVVEGTEGWLLSVHFDVAPAVVLKKGGRVLAPEKLPPVPTHWHEYVNCCLGGGTPTSSFAWAGRLSEMVVLGNEAMTRRRT